MLPILSMAFMFNSIGCGIGGLGDEIARITSPDDKVDAVLYRNGGAGAVSSTVYNLIIVKKGGDFSKDNSVLFQADHVDSLKIEWEKADIFKIKYREARIYKFCNFWQHREVDNFRHVIELQLEQTKSGYALSNRDRGKSMLQSDGD